MKKHHKKLLQKITQPPGTLFHVGEKKTEKVVIQEITYSPEKTETREISSMEDLSTPKENGVTWLNITGIHETGIVQAVGSHYRIHPLVLEDILNAYHRPKLEDFNDYLFLVLKMISYDRDKKYIKSEQVSLILGKGYVITFQENEGDVFQGVRERINHGRGRIRKMGADYLSYALIDAIVDNYFYIIEAVGEEIEEIEANLLEDPDPAVLLRNQQMRKELIYLRKGVWPLREILNSFLRGDSPLIKKQSMIFFRDVYDHTIQVIENTESFRDLVSGLQDLYLSSVSNRMNQVMKVLTIIATIFIPLSFIAGIYGMNFEVMPELKWRFGYLAFWIIISCTGLGLFFYFKRKKWM